MHIFGIWNQKAKPQLQIFARGKKNSPPDHVYMVGYDAMQVQSLVL
jgi:hypothetical protein